MFCKWILNTELIGNQLCFQRGGRLFVSNPVAQGYLFIIAQLRAEEKPGFDVEVVAPDGNKLEVAVIRFRISPIFRSGSFKIRLRSVAGRLRKPAKGIFTGIINVHFELMGKL